MIPAASLPRPWPPGRRFWLTHAGLPAIAFVLLAALFETTPLDLWFADGLFALEGGAWLLRDHWFTYELMHHYGKLAVIAFGAVMLALALASCCVSRLKPWRWPLAYLVSGLVLVPALISLGKHFSDVPCPWDLARYGGELAWRHSLAHDFGWMGSGVRSCFPAGHAAGGFALLTVYFAAWRFARRPALFLLPGLATGVAFGLAQQVRGAHFVSHDLWTATLAWFLALGLFVLFRPGRWTESVRPG